MFIDGQLQEPQLFKTRPPYDQTIHNTIKRMRAHTHTFGPTEKYRTIKKYTIIQRDETFMNSLRFHRGSIYTDSARPKPQH